MELTEDAPLEPAQKEYLQGFTAGLSAAGLLGGPPAGTTAAGADAQAGLWFGTPVEDLCREERFKIEEDPFSIWDRMLSNARTDTPPTEADVFRYKYHGLFYVAPAQDSFMVRIRVPANVLRAGQLRAVSSIARDLGGGWSDLTTRGNIQVRQIPPRSTIEVLMRLAECGLSSRGSGADNVRNVTASPGAGIDAEELADTRELARAMQFYLSNNADLYGLPRKFNIAFDGAGRFSNVAATNDIAFTATRRVDDPDSPVRFRVALAGITGHLRFAEDAGIVVAPEECTRIAGAILRVFAAHGDRTDRKKARLCYLLDRVGLPRFLEMVEAEYGSPLERAPSEAYQPRGPVDKRAHLGIHPQSDPELYYAGLTIPVGRLTCDQMDRLADLAERYSHGEIRLTVWQNAMLPNVPAHRIDGLRSELEALGLLEREGRTAPQMVACTGNTGCRFAASDTKGHALILAAALDAAVTLDTPLNIHLTGCPHSCAQHYCADIGLLGAAVETLDGPSVEGYHVYVGGGCENEQGLARELARNVPFTALPALLVRLVQGFLARRQEEETFVQYCARSDIEALHATLEMP